MIITNNTHIKKVVIFIMFVMFFIPISERLQADDQEFNTYEYYVPIILDKEKLIIVTFPKIGSLSLIKWAMAVSGFANLYGIDVKLPSLYYNPSNYYEAFVNQPNLTCEFLEMFCKDQEMDWHPIFHHPNCLFNLQNSSELSTKINDSRYEKYIVIRNIRDRLITAYINHYDSFKNDLILTNCLSPGEEYSFKQLLGFLYTSKFKDSHIAPYSNLLPFEIKNNSMLMSNIPNIHKNKLFGNTIYPRIYEIPMPFLNKGAPIKDREDWFDEEMKQQVKEIFYEDLELFGSSCF